MKKVLFSIIMIIPLITCTAETDLQEIEGIWGGANISYFWDFLQIKKEYLKFCIFFHINERKAYFYLNSPTNVIKVDLIKENKNQFILEYKKNKYFFKIEKTVSPKGILLRFPGDMNEKNYNEMREFSLTSFKEYLPSFNETYNLKLNYTIEDYFKMEKFWVEFEKKHKRER